MLMHVIYHCVDIVNHTLTTPTPTHRPISDESTIVLTESEIIRDPICILAYFALCLLIELYLFLFV